FTGARWVDQEDGSPGGPAVGAQFVGSNTHPAIGEWDVPCFVDRCAEPSEFGWVTSDVDNPGARWRFEASSIAGATRLRFSVVIGPGPSGISAAIDSMPDKEPRILARRVSEHRANMTKVIEGIKAAAEADAAAAKSDKAGGAAPPLS
ncbi:MAG: hypothetical protein AAFO29_03150, partial [Actinomycetota bacterium]